MNTHFKILAATRALISRTIEGLSLEQLIHIPEGYNNNIAWNFGHVLVTQKLLTYGLSKENMGLSDDILAVFRKGAKPEFKFDIDTIKYFKENYSTSVDLLKEDYENHLFDNFSPYQTSYGPTLQNIEEAIVFNNTHEALHLGYIMAMKKLV